LELYAALAKGDAARIERLLHPDFVGTTTAGLPLDLGGTYHGAQSMRDDFWWQIGRSFRAEAVPEDFQQLDDDRLYVHGRYQGEGRRSKQPLDAAFVHVLQFDGDLIVSLQQLTDSAAWAQALGEVPNEPAVQYSVSEGVAVVRLNRPQVRNAINTEVAELTLDAAQRIAGDPSVRAVVIAGNGPALTVGGDISYFLESEPEELGELFARMTAPFHEAFRILSRIDAPIITAAHGSVAGGGLGYVYAADIVLAAEGTKFVTAFADLGLSGDGGGTWQLPRLIGVRRAIRMYLENTPLDAADAAEWGLISEVVPAEELEDRAMALAHKLAAGPTVAFGRMRRMMHDSWTTSYAAQLLEETIATAATGSTADAADAILAFTQKRRPHFEGR
jgi:2-(1,2-epoxy-1,2-dihydrophenyl)acetyl-CoA isomerase